MTLLMGTPLAESLSNRIQPKLVEIGWTVGGDDTSPLSEYICLMLVNGKSQDQIAAELSGDLLGLSPNDQSAKSFVTWLFGQVDELKAKEQDESNNNTNNAPAPSPSQSPQHAPDQHQSNITDDMEMRDDSTLTQQEAKDGVPTGPRAMRAPNPRRLMNQLSKAMERSTDDALHRVRHGSDNKFKRDPYPPRGPSTNRGPNSSRHPNNLNNRNGHNNNRRNGNFQAGSNVLNAIGHGNPNNMTPHQQMAFYQMFQQQSHMMAPFSGPMPPMLPGGPNGNFHGGPPRHHHNNGPRMMEDPYANNFAQPRRVGGPDGNRGSLFDRIQAPPPDKSPSPPPIENDDAFMDTGDDTVSSNGNPRHHDSKPEEVPCKYGTGCTKSECIFGHPTPAAPTGRGVLYVSGEKCPFGSGCRNRKCTGSHPSPAGAPSVGGYGKAGDKIQADCKFFPNCTNAACPFRHPKMPLCRNGTSCERADCHFTHTAASEVECRFTPCLNPECVYKHEEGQQQPTVSFSAGGNRVWTAPGKGREHVSERKFINDAEEELILPGATVQEQENGGISAHDVSMDAAPAAEDDVELADTSL